MGTRAGLDHASVVQVAAELTDSKGLEEVSLAVLVAQLGVRSPTLHHYIDGLPALRHDLALLGTRILAQRPGRAVMGYAAEEAILALANAYRAFVKEHSGLSAATVRAAALDEYKLRAAKQDEAILAVRMERSMVHGFVS